MLISNVNFLTINEWMNHRDQRSWKTKVAKRITTIAIAYVVSIAFEHETSNNNTSSSFITMRTFSTSIVAIRILILSTISNIDSLLKHTLNNDLIIYDEKFVIDQIATIAYKCSKIWRDREIIVNIFETKWMSIIIKDGVTIKTT